MTKEEESIVNKHVKKICNGYRNGYIASAIFCGLLAILDLSANFNTYTKTLGIIMIVVTLYFIVRAIVTIMLKSAILDSTKHMPDITTEDFLKFTKVSEMHNFVIGETSFSS